MKDDDNDLLALKEWLSEVKQSLAHLAMLDEQAQPTQFFLTRNTLTTEFILLRNEAEKRLFANQSDKAVICLKAMKNILKAKNAIMDDLDLRIGQYNALAKQVPPSSGDGPVGKIVKQLSRSKLLKRS